MEFMTEILKAAAENEELERKGPTLTESIAED
jgi:hypothetical protein